MNLSTHFKAYEFACHCGKCETVLPPDELLQVLEDVREAFKRPVVIMSGYRCEDHNRSVGGAKRSKHKLGVASDIIVSGVSPSVVQGYLHDKYPDSYGIGSYAKFTHIDVRESKARW